ncbi:facilitated trehalose transporter Tret1-like [Bacillus rossius redtenbacheri]|uniref:facilitated trehalose transporter Tret1-like n=1 Tax=Bacillus rossius redtenbacheri TaxID=93214 RepID=UPI002FDDDE55
MEKSPTRFKQLIPQVLLGLVAAMTTVPSGMNMGFPSVALTPLTSNNTEGHLDQEQASWFASISSIATPVGCLVCGPLLDRFGRRAGLLSLAPVFTAGWLLLLLRPACPASLYLARVVAGLGTGLASVPGAIFLGEAADRGVRGAFVAWPSVAISLGIFAVYVLGALFKEHWRSVALLSAAVPPATALLTYLFVPETPTWLLTRGRVREAEASFRKLRNLDGTQDIPEDLGREFRAMSVRAAAEPPETGDVGYVVACRRALAPLRLPQAWKPLVVLNTYFFFQQFSGIYVVVGYAVDMVELAGVVVDAYTAAVVLATVQLVAGVVVSFMMTSCGRRPLSIASGSGMTTCMFALAVYLQISGVDSRTSHAVWLPLTALSLYVLSNAIGFHTLPWAMIGEIFPARVSGLAGGITTFMAYLFNFFALKTYPTLKTSLGAPGVFYLYGSVSLLATVFVAIFLPETHGKTLHEIEEMFAPGRCTPGTNHKAEGCV